jgi:DNA-binding transcriptional regulator/RsmH inhibitor MraZ
MRKKIIAQLKAKFQNELRLNKSHLGLLRSIIESLLVLHTVNLVELSTKICGKSKMNSAYRRLQRFFSKVEL